MTMSGISQGNSLPNQTSALRKSDTVVSNDTMLKKSISAFKINSYDPKDQGQETLASRIISRKLSPKNVPLASVDGLFTAPMSKDSTKPDLYNMKPPSSIDVTAEHFFNLSAKLSPSPSDAST
jgi:hypothetical protein